MIDKKEQFVLALQGWTYKGILDDRYHGADGPGYCGSIRNILSHVLVPERAIGTKGYTKNGSVIIFLKDYTYYILGNYINE